MGYRLNNMKRNPLAWRWGLWAVLSVVILAAGLYAGGSPCVEGLVREGICRELLAGHTAGRQGVISSIWWGPFPTIAMLPIVFLCPPGAALPVSLVVSALFGAGAVILLEQVLRMWGAGRWRWILAGGLCANPLFIGHCWSGSSWPMIACLLVLSLYSVTAWVETRRLRDLIWFAVGGAILLGTGYEMSGWVLAAIAVIAVEEARRRVTRAEKGAVLTVSLLPLLYVAMLWLLMNWLIMGDPLYALRSLMTRGPGPGGALILPDLLWWCHAGLAAVVGLTLLLALHRHDRAGVCLSVLGLALPGAAGLLAWRERLWDAAPLLLALLPAAMLALGHLMAPGQLPAGSCPESARSRGVRGRTAWLVALLVSLAAGALPLAAERAPARASGQAPAVWLANLEHHVRQRTPYAKVFVCGFESFAVLKDRSDTVFEHALDFNFDKAERDYYGHVIYLLVHRPEQRNAMDSIHWKYRNIYVQGGENTLYDSDWGDWRLFEVIQAAAPR